MPRIDAQNERVVVTALRKIGQAFCRHPFVLKQYRGDRLLLVCQDCGRESVGIDVADRMAARRRLAKW